MIAALGASYTVFKVSGMSLGPHHIMTITLWTIIFIVFWNWERLGRQLSKISFLETFKEREERKQAEFERTEQEKDAAHERRLKEQREQLNREQQEKAAEERKKLDEHWNFINQLGAASQSIKALLKAVTEENEVSESYQGCQLNTRRALARLKERGFEVPDPVKVPKITQPGIHPYFLVDLSPEEASLYDRFRHFFEDIIPYAEVGREEELKGLWDEKYKLENE